MNKEYFVTYNQAVILKELGFDELCDHYYVPCTQIITENTEDDYNISNYRDFNHDRYMTDIQGNTLISAPTLAQVQDWLRIVHRIYITSDIYFSDYRNGYYIDKAMYGYIYVDFRKDGRANRISSSYNRNKKYNFPEKAISAGIDECLSLLTNNE